MVNFPEHFIPLKHYPGYFWDDTSKRLFSLKVSGVLRPLTLSRATIHNSWPEDGYRISIRGVRRVIFPSRIERHLDRREYFYPVTERK